MLTLPDVQELMALIDRESTNGWMQVGPLRDAILDMLIQKEEEPTDG